jgi:hypothetical protein
VQKILDIGCGEGELLQALCQPAPWLQPPSETSEEHVALHKNEILNLHPTRVFGLDVSVDDLQVAIANTAPFEDFPRWEPVEAKIWEGGLEVFNPSFVDMECIVAMEVYVASATSLLAPVHNPMIHVLPQRRAPT